MGIPEQMTTPPLVGPGSELQLTLDGGAVLHAEVVAALDAPPDVPLRVPRPAPVRTRPAAR